LLFCHGALSLRDRGRNFVRTLRGVLLLVSENDWLNAERASGRMAFLAVLDWFSPDVRRDAHSGTARDAAPDLHLWARPRLGHLELHHYDRCVHSGTRDSHVSSKPRYFLFQGSRGG